MLKCLIPASVVPQEAVVRAVVWLGVGKLPISTQVSAFSFKIKLLPQWVVISNLSLNLDLIEYEHE